MPFNSEYGEDRWINDNIALPKHGFYVDIGAMRPDVDSNTSFLRDMGWFGLAIDGHPDCARWWTGVPKVRFVGALLGPKSLTDRDVVFATNVAQSRIVTVERPLPPPDWPTMKLRPVTLESVLRQEGATLRIDFLSIDVEGMEYDVIKEMRLDVWRPRVIVAEYHTSRIGYDYRLMHHLLDTNKYSVVHRTTGNLVYLYREGVLT